MTRSLPLTGRFLLLVLLVVVAPLALMGYWLAGTAARSGEELLRSRLRQTSARATAEMASNWLRPRSALLSFAEDSLVQQTLTGRLARSTAAPKAPTQSDGSSSESPTSAELRFSTNGAPPWLSAGFDSLPQSVVELGLRDASRRELWRLSRGPMALPTFEVRVPVYARIGGHQIGQLEARLLGDAVVGPGLASVAGAVIAVLDPATGASLRGLPFDPAVLADSRFEWDGEVWVAERRVLLDPRLDVVSAAPLAEFASPFEAAARRGLAALIGVALLATALFGLLTRRMTRSLSRLAAAADSVGRGDLEVRLPEGDGDEVGRVTDAFNRMSGSLQRTLAELSHREALAAVGGFASELAHEVRNPLTSIKVDLQFVEEQLPAGSETRAVQVGAIEEIARLDLTVAGVLQIARSGRIKLEPLDLREPLWAALRVVEPVAEQAGSTLCSKLAVDPLLVRGDTTALQQMFTNVIVNAAQAGAKRIEVIAEATALGTAVRVRDDGPGIPTEQLARVREPFFSTRTEGTGLGLAIAERIATAHQAELKIESEVGRGTVVSVSFADGRSGSE